MLEKLTQDNYEKIIAGKDKPVVIDFFSPECRHCKMTEVGLLELAEEQKDAERYEYFREISMAHYEQDYKEVMRQILEKITAQIGVTQKTVDDRIPRMLAFIEKNYEQDLRLEDMAEEFNFNYHYLSAYFHQHMKEGFSDYLNEIRTAKACELLENTDLSIAQISEKVGYSEHSYFCRVFKKVTGKTPSVYRRKNHG